MEKTIGFAFGGGGAKTFTQLGALKELEKLNIKPNYCAGTSMGAVNAILYAAGYTIDEIINFYNQKNLFDMFGIKFTKYGLATNEGLGFLIQQMCSEKGVENLQDLPLTVYVAATNEKDGPVTIKTGSIKDAVMATTATMCVESHKMESGEILKDGCYTKNVPFDLLDEVRQDKNIKGKHFDFCFDSVPKYNWTIIFSLNDFNKKILKNDRERKKYFKENCTGCYIDLNNSISQVSFNKVSVKGCVKLGKEATLKKLAKLEDNEFFDLSSVRTEDKTKNIYQTTFQFEENNKPALKEDVLEA